MRIYDIIAKKRDKKELTAQEIDFAVKGYTDGTVEDYQMSALLMAIYINSMTEREIFALTKSMSKSGETVDLSFIPGIKVDKHSTGGVGDKTTLIVSPIVAACGVPVAKMSGRGLGYTGGTIDKLESIPGMRTNLSTQEFFDTINQTGLSIGGQSKNLDPADKKIYALRDVTATVDSIPLIASSIMSKKLASGSDCILLDVKCGRGAFMQDFDSALKLAKTMVSIGQDSGKDTVAVITNMDVPLGYAVGNWVEVMESCEILKNKGNEDLRKISIYLAANMLYLAGEGSISKCKEMAHDALKTGMAFRKFKEMVEAQGGDTQVIEHPEKYPRPKVKRIVTSDKEGYVNLIDASKCGKASSILGAGREKKDDPIDYVAGVVLSVKVGEYVKAGEPIAKIYSNNAAKCDEAENIMLEATEISDTLTYHKPLIQARVTSEGVERFG